MKLSDILYNGSVLSVEDLATDKAGKSVIDSAVSRATLHLGDGITAKIEGGWFVLVKSAFGSALSPDACRTLAESLRQAASTMEDAGRLWERFEPVAPLPLYDADPEEKPF